MSPLILLSLLACNDTKNTDSGSVDTADDSGIQDTATTEPAALVLESPWATEETHRVEVDDIFAIWWDQSFDHDEDLSTMF